MGKRRDRKKAIRKAEELEPPFGGEQAMEFIGTLTGDAATVPLRDMLRGLPAIEQARLAATTVGASLRADGANPNAPFVPLYDKESFGREVERVVQVSGFDDARELAAALWPLVERSVDHARRDGDNALQ